MMDSTEQQILDVALTAFSHEGYLGATAKFIADKSGFSELTLFRKFKNKENLFNTVIDQNTEKFKQEYQLVFINKKIQNKEEFLKTTITDTGKLIEDNIEYIRLIVLGCPTSEPVMEQFINQLSNYLKENIKDDKKEYSTYSHILVSSLIMLYNDEYLGRGFVDHEKTLEYLTDGLSLISE